MEYPLLATIILFAGNFAPKGWAFCDGSLQNIENNAALFSLLGTKRGSTRLSGSEIKSFLQNQKKLFG